MITLRWPLFAAALWMLSSMARGAQPTNEATRLFMPDGQLRSHLIRLYVNEDIAETMEPRLVLHVPHTLLRPDLREHKTNELYRLSRDYRWSEQMDGQARETRGTLLLFDLHAYPIPWYKAMTRITPILIWQELGQARSVVGENEVYLANTNAAAMWSALVVAAIGLLIARMSWYTTAASGLPAKARVFAALANPDGSLSLSRAQLTAWTAAIGGVVFGFGLIRLEVPEIPETLVALMGLSLVTGGLSALKQPPALSGSPPQEGGLALANPTLRLPMQLSDLITDYSKDTGQREVSVAKAQMIFWTILTLGVFVTKSMTDGTLWPVPWQLVALMGMSQAGYVVPKFVGPQP